MYKKIFTIFIVLSLMLQPFYNLKDTNVVEASTTQNFESIIGKDFNNWDEFQYNDLPSMQGIATATYDEKIYIGGRYPSSNETFIFDGFSWSKGPDFLEARRNANFVVYKDNLYKVGGTNNKNGTVTSIWRLSENKQSWDLFGNLPTGVTVPGLAVLGENLYSVGGYNGANRDYVQRFNGTNWEDITTTDRLPVSHPTSQGIVTYENRIYITGVNGKKVYSYDGTGDGSGSKWKEETSLPAAMDLVPHVSVVYHDRIYAIGGTNVFSWRPGESEWRTEPNLPASRYRHGGDVLGEHIYILGGSPKGNQASTSNTVYRYPGSTISCEQGSWQGGNNLIITGIDLTNGEQGDIISVTLGGVAVDIEEVTTEGTIGEGSISTIKVVTGQVVTAGKVDLVIETARGKIIRHNAYEYMGDVNASNTTFIEHPNNDGSIETEVQITLNAGTFAFSNGKLIEGTHYTVTNVPDGLTVDLMSTSASTATLRLIGHAANHEAANSILNFEINFLDAAFTTGTPASIQNREKEFSINFNSALTVPDAPTNVTATAGDEEATVSFSEPTNNGGTEIVSYTVTATPVNGGEEVHATGTESPITISGLTNGTSYQFTVVATNQVGNSIPSSPTETVTPSSDDQQIPDQKISLSWSDGSTKKMVVNAIKDAKSRVELLLNKGDSYDQEEKIDILLKVPIEDTSKISKIEVEGTVVPAFEVNDTTYYIIKDGLVVTEQTSNLTINFDLTFSSVTNESISVQVLAVSDQAYDKRIEFSPNTSEQNQSYGAFDVTGGPLFYSKNAKNVSAGEVVQNSGDSFMNNLTLTKSNDDIGIFRVIHPIPTVFLIYAYSEHEGESVTLNLNQFQDSDGRVLSGSLVITYSEDGWIPSVIDGLGSDSYSLENGSLGSNLNTELQHSNIFSLMGSEILNSNSNKAVSNQLEIEFNVIEDVNTVTVPDAPTNIVATPGNGQVTLYFNPPTNNGGAEITAYQVTANPGGIIATGSSSPITITGLTNGVTYTFVITAKNSVGSSVNSAVSTATPTAPPTPEPEPTPTPEPEPTPTSEPEPEPTPQPTTEQIVVDVDGNDGSNLTKTPITRSKDSNGKVKDQVTMSEDIAKETVKKAKEQGINTARIIIPDSEDKVSEVRVEIPKTALKELNSGNLRLEIVTDNTVISIPTESLSSFEKDLYFRVVPIKSEEEKKQVENRAKTEKLVKEVAKDQTVQILGRPMEIETNMQSHEVLITLPLKNSLPEEAAKQQEILNNLGVFIEHSDGTKELIPGKVVKMHDGTLGLQFTVMKFSTFTMIYMDGWEEYMSGQKVIHTPYIHGVGNGNFAPNARVTRAQMAAMLARNLDKEPATNLPAYQDVSSKHWAYADIMEAKNAGIMLGISTTKFDPEGSVTRAQMAAIAYRWIQAECKNDSAAFDSCGKLEPTTGKAVYKDVHSMHWAIDAINFLKATDIMVGDNGNFRPEEKLTRAEAVKVLNRLFKRGPLTGATTPTFKDVLTTHWAFEEIEEAAREHQFTIGADGKELLK